jgi:hypothetical protein
MRAVQVPAPYGRPLIRGLPVPQPGPFPKCRYPPPGTVFPKRRGVLFFLKVRRHLGKRDPGVRHGDSRTVVAGRGQLHAKGPASVASG